VTVLVTGATGRIGRHVVAGLAARGGTVRALVRAPAGVDLPAAVDLREGDLTRPHTVAPAFDGARALFLFPVAATAAAIARLARRCGVGRVVVLSCGSAGHGDEYHLTVERAVQDAGLEWTCLRPYGLMSNALLWADSVRAESVVRAPHARFTYPHIHPADVADVAVAALVAPGHAGATHTLSGGEAISQLDQARLIGAAIGREVRFDELDREQTHRLWGSWGWPAEAIELELFIQSEYVDTPAPIGTTVADVLGRQPRTFAQWAAEHAEHFR
jgi:uncharacterized protein YbjT (DUF2867 family)